jgi:hypothetical protein
MNASLIALPARQPGQGWRGSLVIMGLEFFERDA